MTKELRVSYFAFQKADLKIAQLVVISPSLNMVTPFSGDVEALSAEDRNRLHNGEVGTELGFLGGF